MNEPERSSTSLPGRNALEMTLSAFSKSVQKMSLSRSRNDLASRANNHNESSVGNSTLMATITTTSGNNNGHASKMGVSTGSGRRCVFTFKRRPNYGQEVGVAQEIGGGESGGLEAGRMRRTASTEAVHGGGSAYRHKTTLSPSDLIVSEKSEKERVRKKMGGKRKIVLLTKKKKSKQK